MAGASFPSTSKCLYEILGVERSATAEEIRSAYRKKALKLHPDKFVQTADVSEEEATARFQELAKAYEVLSDPRERAWYDSHRTQILYSSSNVSFSKKSGDFDIDLWPYFSATAYSGFGNTGKGFYKVYGDLFQRIFESEVSYARIANVFDKIREPPVMGDLKSPYEQVEAFYDYWLGFSTLKGFEWIEEQHVSSAMNRRIRRLVEEGNKKLRRKVKKEYNETVRELAAFVKKRDKRVLQRQIERKKEEEAKAAQARARKKEIERERLERARQYVEPEWARVHDGSDQEGGDENWFDDNRGKKGLDGKSYNDEKRELYCVVCSKKFKSEKQWKNHEQSKKHKEKVAELRETFDEEEELFHEIAAGVSGIELEKEVHNGDFVERVEDEDFGDAEESLEYSVKENERASGGENEASGNEIAEGVSGIELEKEVHNGDFVERVEDEDFGDAEESFEDSVGQNERASGGENESSVSDDGDEEEDDDETSFLESMMKLRRTKQVARKNCRDVDRNEDGIRERNAEVGPEQNQEVMNSNDISDQRKEDLENKHEEPSSNGIESLVDAEVNMKLVSEIQNVDEGQEIGSNVDAKADAGGSTKPEAKKKPQKTAKQPVSRSSIAMDVAGGSKKQAKKKKGKAADKPASCRCEVCGEDFGSRNQLFAHLSKTGHAVLKSR
eukprot:TRINITY_DN9170_c0_g1_i1.p1 TRINITY_DN9170_c0_g1~~TRINITY_DN9170_c0_g1_i1.p1  ORF type:complete len:701 (-),score=211.12 TRINITY_DN9170_c0_g1_i1:148-2160(-)